MEEQTQTIQQPKSFIIALIQMKVTKDKEVNLNRAQDLVEAAVKLHKPQIVILPEFFTTPINSPQYKNYAENESDSKTLNVLKNLAKEYSIYLIGGSFPSYINDEGDSKIYNTCFCIDKTGEIKTVFRKLHLFDVNIPGKIVAKESSRITKGKDFGIFQTKYAKIGIGICYDIRFAEYALLLRKEHNVDMLVYPAAFNTVTGPLHWELLGRSRALDNQLYVALCSPSRNYENPNEYQAWGHSMVVDPYGQVVTSTGIEEDILVARVDLSKNDEIRTSIPVWYQKRWDVYNLSKTEN
jgi:omega-amidase